MIFDDVAMAMNRFSAREVARMTGLTRGRVYSLQNGCPFYLNYDMVFALEKLGYQIKLEKIFEKK